MFAFALVAAAAVGVGGLLTVLLPDPDDLRVAEARRELRRAGLGLRKGSPEETHALRVLLDGGTVDQI